MTSVIHRLIDSAKIVQAFPPGTPSISTPDYVSMKGHDRLLILISVDNGSTVTGSAVTLSQAKTVGAGSEKPLAFAKAFRNIDTGAAGLLAEFAVTSNTFTTDTTNAKNLLYAIEVAAEDLDVANGFDCVRLGLGDAANTVIDALYVLYGQRYYSPSADPTVD
ncbi:MAG: hypothetical protein AB7P23_01790 [Amphiplicatus sp.]